MKKKIVSASIYPAILMVVGALVIGFLMFYVVPRFARVYEDMAGTLPFFSQLLLGFGNFVGNNALAIAIAGVGVARRRGVGVLARRGPRLARTPSCGASRRWASA